MGGPILIGIEPDPLTLGEWPRIWAWLANAHREDGPLVDEGHLVWTVREVRGWLRCEAVAIAAATTRMMDDGRAEVILVGGERAPLWTKALADKICAWAKDEGATSIIATGRPGWARLLDWAVVGEVDGLVRYERQLA